MANASTRRSDTFVLAVFASLVSIASFLYFYSHDKILLYGDAVAHINIARRVFDSQFPGLAQLGTVWLPLPHLLMIPFIVNDKLWSSGIGASLPSMVAFVFGAVGLAKIFWSSRVFAEDVEESKLCWAGWLAAVVYLCNPNLLYMQSTAMTEPLALSLAVWSVYFYCRFVAQQRAALLDSIDDKTSADGGTRAGQSLLCCGFVLAAAALTRYDCWVLAAAIAIAVFGDIFVRYRSVGLVRYKQEVLGRLRRKSVAFAAIVAIVPLFWLAYNQALFGNALEFANGRYSARAIEERSLQAGNPPHPGSGSITAAATQYWAAARLNVESGRLGMLVLLLAVLGGVALLFTQTGSTLLLWLPLGFYVWSVAYGGIPIFVPDRVPFSYYNVRYGLELLPAIAVSCGYLLLVSLRRFKARRTQLLIATLLFALVGAAYVRAWVSGPACLREGEINSAARIGLHKEIAATLQHLPSDSTFVVSLTEHVGVFERARIPLRRTWNESSHRKGEKEFPFPLTQGDYVLAFDGDQVAEMVAQHPESVQALAVFHVAGEKRCVLYKSVRS
ncbi:MAG: hypothetical protein ACJ71N_13845 [Terriglobales bacterium]